MRLPFLGTITVISVLQYRFCGKQIWQATPQERTMKAHLSLNDDIAPEPLNRLLAKRRLSPADAI
ncbi:MAG: hypothetical protein ACOYKQ_05555, partial [Polymorphobacter sp.]